ncbi:lipid A export ATP-binding/permease protein [Campylobacter novaezeelandiae]|nr:lipid A export ATP-binding/permease protein [Campylobacter novaezeelandiae]
MEPYGKKIMQKKMTLIDVLIRFKPFYKQYWKYFLFAIMGMLFASLGTAASAYVIKPILDDIFINKSLNLLYITPFFIFIVYFLKNLGAYLQSYYTSFIGIDILRILRSRVLENLLRLDMMFFKRYRKGELISRCTNDINALQSIVANIIPDFLRELITAIGLLSVVIYQSPTLAFFALIVLPVAIFPLVWFARKLKKYAKITQEKNSDLLSRLSEIFSNIEIIKVNNAENKEKLRFSKENDELSKVILKSVRVTSLTSPIMEIIGSFGVSIVIIVGGREVIHGNMSVGTFFSFITALFMIYAPIKRLSYLYGMLQTTIVASERTFYLLDLKPEIKGGDKRLENISDLLFKNVHFSYESGKEILKGLDFYLKKGEILAFVGPSGGGKSSIVGLILHFFRRNSGDIFINNHSIDDFSLQSLRSKISLVTQDIYIFNDTIAQNVAYNEEFNENKVIEVLKLANAYEFSMQMGGIHSKLYENGKNLSGGQKQRIAIARALYKNPDMLIFDEATSALDNESEKVIINTIESLKKDRLIIMIAHRLSTIENADKIAVIDKGKVLAIGTDQELMQNCHLYQKFKNKEHKIKA